METRDELIVRRTTLETELDELHHLPHNPLRERRSTQIRDMLNSINRQLSQHHGGKDDT